MVHATVCVIMMSPRQEAAFFCGANLDRDSALLRLRSTGQRIEMSPPLHEGPQHAGEFPTFNQAGADLPPPSYAPRAAGAQLQVNWNTWLRNVTIALLSTTFTLVTLGATAAAVRNSSGSPAFGHKAAIARPLKHKTITPAETLRVEEEIVPQIDTAPRIEVPARAPKAKLRTPRYEWETGRLPPKGSGMSDLFAETRTTPEYAGIAKALKE